MHRYQHKYTFPSIIILLVLAILGLIWGYFNMQKNTTVPRGSNMSVLGIELDQTKDYIDLHKLEKNGISFVYLRSTQGKSYFDDNYLLYRDQLQGTNLNFGTIISYSDETSNEEQYQYFLNKVGTNTGTLPVMIVPATSNLTKTYWQRMGRFAQMINNLGKRVMIAGNYHYHKYFPEETRFLYTGASLKDRRHYAFWCYTQNGRVKNIDNLNRDVTMFAYIGTNTQYEQLYGQQKVQ